MGGNITLQTHQTAHLEMTQSHNLYWSDIGPNFKIEHQIKQPLHVRSNT